MTRQVALLLAAIFCLIGLPLSQAQAQISGCPTATTSQIGCVKPDGATITISSGVISSVGGSATSITPGTTTIGGATAPCVIVNPSGTAMGCPPYGTTGDSTLIETNSSGLISNSLISGLPVANLASDSTTANGVTCTLGSTCTLTAAAGTLTGNTLASGVTASSLTSVGTLTGLNVSGGVTLSGLATSGSIGGSVCATSAGVLLYESAANCESSGGVTWPTSGDLVISNGTSSPAGLAPVNGDCVVGSGGSWTAGSCGSGSGLTVGTTTIASGTSGYLLYDNSGILGNEAASSLSIALSQITGLGTGVGTALGDNVGSAGAFVVNGGAGGTPSSLTLTNATGLPPSGLTSDVTTVNGTSCTLGSSCTVAAAAGTLTGSTLASGITASSLTSLGTLSSLSVSGLTQVTSVEGSSNVQSGSTYTMVATDCGKTIIGTDTAAATYTIPSSIVPASGTTCIITVLATTAYKISVNGSAVSAATLVSSHSYTGTNGSAGSMISLTLTTVGGTAYAYLTGDGS